MGKLIKNIIAACILTVAGIIIGSLIIIRIDALGAAWLAERGIVFTGVLVFVLSVSWALGQMFD